MRQFEYIPAGRVTPGPNNYLDAFQKDLMACVTVRSTWSHSSMGTPRNDPDEDDH
jgi:hypothetical protein